MAGAVRLLAADRGLDYRRFGLVAFGGAGPLHAPMIARRVGLTSVVIPPQPGPRRRPSARWPATCGSTAT